METSKKFLKRISTQAQRMSALVQDLLTLSRYDAGMIVNRKEEFDLGEFEINGSSIVDFPFILLNTYQKSILKKQNQDQKKRQKLQISYQN